MVERLRTMETVVKDGARLRGTSLDTVKRVGISGSCIILTFHVISHSEIPASQHPRSAADHQLRPATLFTGSTVTADAVASIGEGRASFMGSYIDPDAPRYGDLRSPLTC